MSKMIKTIDAYILQQLSAEEHEAFLAQLANDKELEEELEVQRTSWISAYLQNELPPQTRQDFDKALQRDPLLREELDLQNEVIQAFKQQQSLLRFQETLQQVMATTALNWDEIPNQDQEEVPLADQASDTPVLVPDAPVKHLILRWKHVWWAAAALFVVAAGTIMWLNNRSNQLDTLLNAYWVPPISLDTEIQALSGQGFASGESVLREGLEQFKKGLFEDARAYFREYMNSGSGTHKEKAQFYDALANLFAIQSELGQDKQNGRLTASLMECERLIDELKSSTAESKGGWYAEANWYLALLYLKMNQHNDAKALLKGIVANPQHPYQLQAKKLLRTM